MGFPGDFLRRNADPGPECGVSFVKFQEMGLSPDQASLSDFCQETAALTKGRFLVLVRAERKIRTKRRPGARAGPPL